MINKLYVSRYACFYSEYKPSYRKQSLRRENQNLNSRQILMVDISSL